MSLYALRDKETGCLFPEYRTGYTNHDLDDIRKDAARGLPPRLFSGTGAARNALRQWRRGPLRRHYNVEYAGFDEAIKVEVVAMHGAPPPERIAAEIQVVRIEFDIHEILE